MGDDLLDDFIRANNERGLGVYGIHVYREGSPPIERRVRSDDRVSRRTARVPATVVR
ncbi:hypothetical protein ACIA5D_49970 [Actinoplanes sp. NPDC051513]|uniref:hypothetical protein n=1 Tax=Actinoplanes sp. NPDC051513 TaxID=3363908 RepID=UPI00379CE930